LRFASYNGYIKIVKLLLDYGADRSADRFQALEWAKVKNYEEVVDLLENCFPGENKIVKILKTIIRIIKNKLSFKI
jgi:ankyrin repeat protein